jgi:Ricin-type beta-trefoil lectin domain-like
MSRSLLAVTISIVGVSWAALAFAADSKESGAEYYKIVNVATGKVLALESDSPSAGDQAVLATDKGNNAQQWKIEKSDGFCQMTNRTSGMALDVNGWSNDEGNPIIVWDAKTFGDQNDNQLWSWDAASQSSDKGVRIKSKSSGLVLDVDGDGKIVQNSSNDSTKSQWWRIVSLQKPKYVRLVNANNGWVLALDSDSATAGARAVLAKPLDSKNKDYKLQEWKLEKDGDYYKLLHRDSGLALDVSDESNEEDHPIIAWDDKSGSDGNDNQRWTWDGAAPTKDKPARLKSKSSGLILDFDDDHNAVQRSANSSSKSQLWLVVEADD